MRDRLLAEEITELKQYRLGEAGDDNEFIVPLQELLLSENLAAFLSKVQVKMNAPDLLVAASMFAKRYGFFAALSLYSMTVLNKRLATSLDNVSLDVNEEGDIWLPTFIFSDLKVELPEANNRNEWRETAIGAIFKENINPVIDQLAKVTKVSKQILWENVAIYIFWFYERMLEEHTEDEVVKRIRDDFSYVVEEASGELFGEYRSNPLKKFYREKVSVPGSEQEVRIRTTCCLYYKTNEEQAKCISCPLQYKKCN
ncbi:siderophore-iron reductase FhuF [Litchfieldia salsa]|uniref:Siderophore-iron reductase FhuF n=1 Tax=Litchfieldia salsa TaxID=930152 RepID=A0A1H0WPC4_9BACI|nr:siderophore-iron reductase FhuF [Litchfieldia salsa]SDP92518.1 siderophore-iron reductase FhuF [Litchfieldia salsa]